MSMKLYVGNLSFNTSNQDLNKFSARSELSNRQTSSKIVKRAAHADSVLSKWLRKKKAKTLSRKLNGKEVDGRELKVNEAKPRENRGGGGRGGTAAVVAAIMAAVADMAVVAVAIVTSSG